MRTFQINFQVKVHESYVETNQMNISIILTIFDELPKRILWTNAGGYRGRGRPKSRWTDGMEEDTRKLGCRNWRMMTTTIFENFTFCWPCIMWWFLVNDQCDAQIPFYVFIFIYNSLHISSTSCSSSGETYCINTASVNSHSMLVAEMCAG